VWRRCQAKARSRAVVSSASRCTNSVAAAMFLVSAADWPHSRTAQSRSPDSPSGQVRLSCAGIGSGLSPDATKS